MNIKQIVSNTIKSLINQKPTQEMVVSCMDYIYNEFDITEITADEINSCVIDWKGNHLQKCEVCNKWIFFEEPEFKSGFVCDDCKEIEAQISWKDTWLSTNL